MSRSRSLITLLALATLGAVTPSDHCAAADRVLALTTDWFSAGSISTLATSEPWNVQADLAVTGSDAVARVHGGLIYVVNRLGDDNVQVIDPAQGFQTIQQFSVGPGTNPQDILIVSSTRAFVSRYETNDLLEVNPSTGEQLGTISLATFADDDGLCEMHRMIRRGDSLYVQVQRMFRQDWPDPWVPIAPSYLAVININTNQLVDVDPAQPGMQGIVLTGLNPIAPIQYDPSSGDLLVLSTGRTDLIDQGGLERIDLQTMQSKGMVITESAIGGNPIDFALATSEKGYVVAHDLAYHTFCASFDPTTGDQVQRIYDPGDYVLTDLLVYPNGNLFLTDRDFFTPGIRVYDTTTDQLIAGPLDTGLPPSELLLLPDAASGVEETTDLSQPIGFPYPNPSTGPVRIDGATRGNTPLSLEVFDVNGRLVCHITATGETEFSWDGRDLEGRAAAPGVYWLRMTTCEGADVNRSVRILP